VIPDNQDLFIQKRVPGMLKEFKEFAMRGSLIDMAVGIIIGAPTVYPLFPSRLLVALIVPLS
jgi:large-conductance mechanosensitive channel